MNGFLQTFWINLLQKLNTKINELLNRDKPSEEMTAADTGKINFFLMVLKCVLNRVLMDCQFDVISDSKQADPLKLAVQNLNDNIYRIGGYMLGGSDAPDRRSECWAVLVDKECGIHHFMSGNEICITAQSGDHITDCFMIWNATKRNNKLYLLCRRHTLDENGTLTIKFFTADEHANEIDTDIPEWESFLYLFDADGVRKRKEIIIPGANHIGFGRYKSPVLSFDSGTYGKPLNYGCKKVEEEIQNTLQLIRKEFEATTTKIFADGSIVRDRDKNGNPLNANVLDEYIYITQPKYKDGKAASLIDSFSPEIRSSAYFGLLTMQLEQYQALMGVQELITHERTGNSATATEIKAMNINNMALEKNIRSEISKGNLETLKADGIYYGIREELWSYDETWKDIYEDEQQTLQNNITMMENGGQSRRDLMRYWFPTLTEDQLDEKEEEIQKEKENSMKQSLDEIMNRTEE